MHYTLISSCEQDSTINNKSSNKNFGDYYALLAGNFQNQYIHRTVMKFSIPNIPYNFKLERANLLLYIFRDDNINEEKTFEIYKLLNAFDENIVSFNRQPMLSNNPYCSFSVEKKIMSFIRIDITNLFYEWCLGISPNHGLMIKALNENKNSIIGFYSKEKSGEFYQPKLELTIVENNKISSVNGDIIQQKILTLINKFNFYNNTSISDYHSINYLYGSNGQDFDLLVKARFNSP